MSAYDKRQILPNVQAACDLLIDNGFEHKVAMRINDDGTITLIDYDTYVDAVLAARGEDDDE
jgi:hypothetical protein